MQKRLTKTLRSVDTWLTPKRFEWLLVGLVGLLFLFSLVASHLSRPYSSDDVTTQTVVQSWENGQPVDAVVGEDSYIIKVPFFALHDFLQPTNSRTKLLVSVLIFNGILLAGVIMLTRALINDKTRRSRLKMLLVYLPIGWYFALSVLPIKANHNFNFMCPDFRNAELGVAFMLVALLGSFAERKQWKFTLKHGIVGALLFGFLAVFLSSDPYFIYILGLPVVLFLGLAWLQDKVTWRRGLGLLAYTVLVIGASFAVSMLVEHMGIVSYKYVPRQFIGIDQLWKALGTTIAAEFEQFSAFIWGEKVTTALLPQLVNCGLLVLSLWAVIQAGRDQLKKFEPRRLILILVVAINLLVFSFNAVNDIGNDRFLFMAVVAQVILLAAYGATIKNTKLQYCLIIFYAAGILINIGASTPAITGYVRHGVRPNAVNYQIGDIVAAEGLTKGYAPYWSSLINTYLSPSGAQFLPAKCENNTLSKLDWVMNKPDFDIPAEKSFYLYSNDTLPPTTAECTPEALGLEPVKTIGIDGTYTLYIFDYDISAGMQHSNL